MVTEKLTGTSKKEKKKYILATILQTDGLAVGAQTSAILRETYIQNMKHKYVQS
jgi:hypothetical protein